MEAISQIAREKNVSRDLVVETLETGLLSACKKRFGNSDHVAINIDPNTGEITCATCHNPHARKLEGYPRSGEKTKKKLRYDDMCGVCHEK